MTRDIDINADTHTRHEKTRMQRAVILFRLLSKFFNPSSAAVLTSSTKSMETSLRASRCRDPTTRDTWAWKGSKHMRSVDSVSTYVASCSHIHAHGQTKQC